mmetsp:Transcript_34540/g.87323  ORF Transcript_34540/g.87323 Transcript_34540/m.87323 type:complete len:310 (-) Transcript_34540:691-1620(-)
MAPRWCAHPRPPAWALAASPPWAATTGAWTRAHRRMTTRRTSSTWWLAPRTRWLATRAAVRRAHAALPTAAAATALCLCARPLPRRPAHRLHPSTGRGQRAPPRRTATRAPAPLACSPCLMRCLTIPSSQGSWETPCLSPPTSQRYTARAPMAPGLARAAPARATHSTSTGRWATLRAVQSPPHSTTRTRAVWLWVMAQRAWPRPAPTPPQPTTRFGPRTPPTWLSLTSSGLRSWAGVWWLAQPTAGWWEGAGGTCRALLRGTWCTPTTTGPTASSMPTTMAAATTSTRRSLPSTAWSMIRPTRGRARP